MEKFRVQFLGGEGRDINHSVNYMMVKIEIDGEEIELYSEYEYPELTDEEKEDYDYSAHEWDGYDECKADFLEQAKRYGLSESDFDFVAED